MDIDEFLNEEADQHKSSGGKNQGGEFYTDRTIEDQILKIKELIGKKQFKEAEKVYFVVKENYVNLAKKQEEERKRLHRELTEINKELLESLNNLKLEIDKKSNVIRQLLAKAGEYLSKGDNNKANRIYLEIRGLFKDLPDAFAEQKMELENEILTFYSKLINEYNRASFKVLSEKTEKIHDHIDKSITLIRAGKIEEAKKEYHLLNLLYNELPDGFLYEKSLLYKKILKLYKLTEVGSLSEMQEEDIQMLIHNLRPPKKGVKPINPILKESLTDGTRRTNYPTQQTNNNVKVQSLMQQRQQLQEQRAALQQLKQGTIKTTQTQTKKPEKKGFFGFLKRNKKEETKTPPQKSTIEQPNSIKKKDPLLDAPPVPPS